MFKPGDYVSWTGDEVRGAVWLVTDVWLDLSLVRMTRRAGTQKRPATFRVTRAVAPTELRRVKR